MPARTGPRGGASSPPPVRLRGEPYGERFGEVFVRMFLRVPSRQVAHVLTAEGNRPVIVAVATAVRTERITPLGPLVEPIRIVERVAGFVPEVHHDLARALEIVRLLLDSRELRVGEIERNPDDGLSRGTTPLVRQVVVRTESPELTVELTLEPLEERLDPRSPDMKIQLADRHPEEGAARGRASSAQVHRA